MEKEPAIGIPARKESKKPKSATDKGKRYRCCICRKKAARKVKTAPYYCDQHRYLESSSREL